MSKANALGFVLVLVGLPVCADAFPRPGGPDDVDIRPAPPKGANAPVALPPTMSHLAFTVIFPKAAIAAQLENGVPRTYPFNSGDNPRTYGNLNRGGINMSIDPATRRINASAGMTGHAQVEGKVLFVKYSIGVDARGSLAASISPTIGPNWEVDPHLDLSAKVEDAWVNAPVIGRIGVRGPVQDAANRGIGGARGQVDAKLKELLNLRPRVAKIWDQIASVQKLSDNPTTWLQITPKAVRWGNFQYTPDAVSAGLTLDLETRAFVQDQAPPVVKTSLPGLGTGGNLGDAFDLSIPVELPFDAVNAQIQKELNRKGVDLPNDASFTVTKAEISSFKDGVLLTLDFRAKQGDAKAASGRLYVTGDLELKPAADELRLTRLAFSNESKEALDRDVDWLGQANPLPPASKPTVIKLGDELARVKKDANARLAALAGKLSKDFAVTMTVKDFHVERLVFGKDRAFALVTAKGKMTAVLRP